MRYVKKLIATSILVAAVGGLTGCVPVAPTMDDIKVQVFKEQEEKFWSLSTVSEDYTLLSVYAGQVGHAALAAYPDKPEIAEEWFTREKECREVSELQVRNKYGF